MSQGTRGYSAQPSNPDTNRIFFSQTNYGRILQPLRENYERKLNKPELPEDVDKRLQKTLQHYMTEVYRVNGPQSSVNTLNQEAFRETTLNIDAWLQKQVSVPVRGAFQQTLTQDSLYESVGSRYEREQQSRAPPPAQPMTSVDFSLPKTDDEDAEDPLEKYERIRKLREAESRPIPVAMPKQARNTIEPSPLSEPSAPSPTTNLPQAQSNNPPAPPLMAPRPQEYIIKQEDVVKYKENEYNLFLYSGDRDWLTNRNENRYNFTINFNPASNSNSATFSPSVKERFRNIVRMELVKTIVSAESLDVSVRVGNDLSGTDTSRILNVLSYPYLMIRISEWTGNGFGTSANIDNTFGLVQYDQLWKSDVTAGNFGYISMTPRYLKAQRVYHPTPLATLQKLSIQVERPDGQPLTTQLDTLDINSVYLAASTNTSRYSAIPDTASYIFIKTKTFFSRFFVAEGDRIQIRGYDMGTDINVISQVANDFNSFVNSTEGHVVVGIGYSASSSAPYAVTDGPNTVGYANYIVIRSRFADPTTGSTARDYFGGAAPAEAKIQTRLATSTPTTTCALLNQNRQSHFVLRLITREMDPTSNLRPDNS
jgi:hypothetical protein